MHEAICSEWREGVKRREVKKEREGGGRER